MEWRPEENDLFLVKSTYILLENLIMWEDRWSDIKKNDFGNLCKGKSPSRVVALSWKHLLEWILMKSNLAIYKIIQPEDLEECALCELEWETSTHLFLFSVVDEGVWNLVMRWIYSWFITPPNLFKHLELE